MKGTRKNTRKVDTHKGVSYGDWYEQQLAEMGADQSTHKVNPPKEGKK